MDRNREARRAAATNNHNHHMAAPPNGLSSSSSRRRHRSNSLRDSPDEDGGVELHEQQPGRLRERERERGVVKKDRDRDRERERASRSKRRRENRMMMMTSHSNRDTEIDDTSEESVNDEEEDEDDDGGNGLQRMLPPPSSNPVASGTVVSTNHHNLHSQQQLHHRKTFPPAANKVIRAAAPPPAWKAADEMIGVSVPRKARSASIKRSHEWVSGSGVVGGGASTEQNHRQSSASPVRLASATASPVPVAPPSPSSSSVSVRKKMKANGGGSKPRPPKSSSKSSSSNPEELEIEIAEVLYGLMTQSQAPSKKENIPSSDNKSTNDNNKSRVSSPISNSTVLPKNSTSLSTVAPKRKKPRQVSENSFAVRNNPVKTEVDHQNQHQHHQSPKTDSSGSAAVHPVAAENGGSFGFTSLPGQQSSSTPSPVLPQTVAVNEGKSDVGGVLTNQEAEKEASAVGNSKFNDGVTTTTASLTMTKLKTANLEAESQKEEKFEIDLMAPPPQQRTSQGSEGDIDFSDRKQIATQELNKIKEDEKLMKCGKLETLSLTEEELKNSKAGVVQESGESLKKSMNEDLRLDLEKPNKDSANTVSCNSNKSLHQALKHQQLSAKPETQSEKSAQPSSMQIPMSVANWPPMGYVAPLQGVISMDGNPMPSAAPIQPIFTQPRPKRCATHCYIARNIHYLQQFMKINPFWPAASAPAPMFGAKPHNVNVMPSTELHANIPQSLQDKSPGLNIFPTHTATKDNKSSQPTSIPDPTQRKQQVLLQQAMPPVTPNNILHGPAFIFPFNQQQAVAAASASVRPGSSKVNSTSTPGGLVGASGAANTATVSMSTSAATSATAPALSFNYPNMSANETQYLAILQNNPYTFPIPAVGAPPNYRGNPHAQAMPLFNGSFYSSQMIHPSQIPQTPQQPPPTQSLNHHPSQSQQVSQTHQNSSGSTSSSQKHMQAQQRQQGGSAAVNGGGSGNTATLHNSYPAAHKNRSNQPSQHLNPPLQARHLENEVTGGEDSPSTAESRASRAPNTMSVYGHNFAMPVHSHNFALMNPQTAAVSGNNSNDKKQQHQQSQQQGLKRGGGGAESSLPQTFAMSFAPMNGSTGAMAQNHAAMFQNLPESLRQTYHHMMTAPASAPSSHHSQQKKEARVSDDASRTASHDFSNVDDDRKVNSGLTAKSGQSIAFSRPDLAKDAPVSSPVISNTSVIDSSLRNNNNINLGANSNRSNPRSSVSNSVAAPQSTHQLHTQLQQQHHQHQQQVLQLQKQQQQQQQQQQQHHQLNARSKNPPSSNGGVYPDHLVTSSSSIGNAKFPSSLSSFPLQTSNASSSPVQSPQWRSSVRGPATSQAPSSLATSTASSLKNHLHQSHQTQQQQQSSRPHQPHQPSHTQISFGAASQKLPSTTSSSTSHMQQQQQSQNQNQNQNQGSNSNNHQSPSPPMLVGSPTTSSMSKGGGGSPRMNAAGSASTSGRPGQTSSSLSSSQQVKNSPVGTQRSSPSILGNPHNSNSAKSQQQHLQQQQQQVPKQVFQQHQAQAHAQAQAQAQAHMFYTHPYMQVQQAQAQAQAHAQAQAQQHSGSPNTAAGYYAQRKQQQQASQPPQNHQTSSTEMLSLCPPVTLANTTTTSDPAKAIAAATSNLKGGGVGLGSQSQQGILHAASYGGGPQSNVPAGFPQYAPAAVQVKPVEQKQPAGNDNLRTWQPEKK